MRYLKHLGALIILLSIGCSGIQLSQDYDPATDFGSLKHFTWASPTQPVTGDARIDNPFRDTRIREAVNRLLQEKGYIHTSEATPDFLVRYQYTLRRRIDSEGPAGGIGFGIGSYGRHGGIAIGTGNTVSEYDEGTLVIDIVDSKSDTLLWRGSGTERFMEYDDPQKTRQNIDSLVKRILDQFPPQP